MEVFRKKLDQKINDATKTILIEWDKLPLTKFYDMCDIKILVDLNRNLVKSIGESISKSMEKVDEVYKPLKQKDKIQVDYKKDPMNHIFYNSGTDFSIDYNDEDMDYIVDDNYMNRDNNCIDKVKVKCIETFLTYNNSIN